MALEIIGNVKRIPALWRLRVLQQLARIGIREETLLIILSVVIGLAAAGAAWVFEHLRDVINSQYYQRLAIDLHFNRRWLILLPILPMIGGLLVSVIRWFFHRDANDLHGLAGVMLALIRRGGKLDHLLGLETLLASTTTIGTGGSAGPEAPIAIIGSSLGSSIGRLLGISRRHLPTLVGCGAAAGISAVFDAPIAGVLFALEVLLRDFSIKTFTPIVISAVIATTAFHNLNHTEVAGHIRGIFEMPIAPAFNTFSLTEAPYYVFLGVLCGLLAVFATSTYEGVGTLCRKLPRVPEFFYPAIGAGLNGFCGVLLILILSLPLFAVPHPRMIQAFTQDAYMPIFGGGYETVKMIIDPSFYPHIAGAGLDRWMLVTVAMLMILCVLKVIATSLTLGSGGSGGVFAPAIFFGSMLGGAFGLVLQRLVPSINAQPSAYALVAMGTTLAAVIQAPLMGIILLFELTRNYQVMLPIMLSAVSATLVFQLMIGESLYVIPLISKGIHLGSAVGVSALRRVGVDQMPLETAPIVRPDEPLSSLIKKSEATGIGDFVVLDKKDRYLGLVTLDELAIIILEPESAPLLVVGEVVRTDVPPLNMSDTAERALELFSRHEVAHLAVIDDSTVHMHVRGMLSRSTLMRRYHEELSR